jgi:hypothetical protein
VRVDVGEEGKRERDGPLEKPPLAKCVCERAGYLLMICELSQTNTNSNSISQRATLSLELTRRRVEFLIPQPVQSRGNFQQPGAGSGFMSYWQF